MSRDALRLAAVVLCVWGTAFPVAATAEEFGIASAGVQQAGAANGTNVMLGWLSRHDTYIVTAAMDHTAVEHSNWTVLRIGGTSFRSPRLSLSGSVDVGPALIDGDRSTYKKASFEAAFSVSDNWTVKALDTYVDVAPQSGHTLGAAVIRTDARGLLLQAQATASISGNLDERNLSLRADYLAHPPYLLGGVVVGESNNRLLLNIPSLSDNKSLRQAFAGVVLPLRRVQLTLVADVADTDGSSRRALTIGFTMPVENTQ